MVEKTFGFSSEQVDLFIQKCGEITFVTKIDVGNVIFENSIDPDGKLVASMTINIQKYEGQYLDESLALVFGVEIPPVKFPELGLSPEEVEVTKKVLGVVIIVVLVAVLCVEIAPAAITELLIDFLIALGLVA